MRSWVTLRSKLAGKVVVGESEGRRQGDQYYIVFRGPDGEPLKIPLAVYERLPADSSRRARAHLLINQTFPSQALKSKQLPGSVPELCLNVNVLTTLLLC